jgi:hypothetical protein
MQSIEVYRENVAVFRILGEPTKWPAMLPYNMKIVRNAFVMTLRQPNRSGAIHVHQLMGRRNVAH